MQDNLRFSCRNLSSNSKYTLFSQSSQILKQARIENPNGINQIDCQDLNNGVYFLQIVSENQTITKKIVVIR